MGLKLFGGVGGGSAAIEAALEMAGIDYEFIQSASWDGAEALAKLTAVNPLGQIPVLILEDGTVMTESAALMLWIGDRAPHLAWACVVRAELPEAHPGGARDGKTSLGRGRLGAQLQALTPSRGNLTGDCRAGSPCGRAAG